jgi:hypothetical protein
LGDYTFTCSATDSSANTGQSTCEVHIVDTAPPVITPSPDSTLEECDPDPHLIALPLPSLTDSCGQGNPVLSGTLVAVNGKPVTPAVAIPADGRIVLPVGTAKVRWKAVDSSGNQSSVEQVFTIVANLTVDCCEPGQFIYQGGNGQDYVYRDFGAWCVLGWGGGDFVQTVEGDDLLIGGDGADNLNAGAGRNILIGGEGADANNCGSTGICEIHAGPGDDMAQALYSASAEIWGGTGNDNITGSAGADLIVPGSGVDTVSAGSGNDTVILYDVCEAVSRKVLDGGSGTDTLIIPASKTQILAKGVTLRNFETVIVDSTKTYLSPCH